MADVAGPNEHGEIVFFDGYCGLCDGFVTWLIRRDRDARFRVAPLQGETARTLLEGAETQDTGPGGSVEPDPTAARPDEPPRTIVLVTPSGEVYRRSEAVLRIVAGLGGVFAGVRALRWLPRPIRDAAYRLVARYRYRVFGRRDTCRVPTPEERERFLP